MSRVDRLFQRRPAWRRPTIRLGRVAPPSPRSLPDAGAVPTLGPDAGLAALPLRLLHVARRSAGAQPGRRLPRWTGGAGTHGAPADVRHAAVGKPEGRAESGPR